MADITVYGADWCPDCRRSKRFLGEHRIAYDWVDQAARRCGGEGTTALLMVRRYLQSLGDVPSRSTG